jgi:DNA-binding transcriptional LysR family regulator
MEDLAKHTVIGYGETVAPEVRDVNWLLDTACRASNGCGRALRINNITGILHAVEAGIGIAALPDYLTAERPHLVRILPDTEGPTYDVHLVYCDALRQSKRVAAFRDFLVRAARDWKY